MEARSRLWKVHRAMGPLKQALSWKLHNIPTLSMISLLFCFCCISCDFCWFPLTSTDYGQCGVCLTVDGWGGYLPLETFLLFCLFVDYLGKERYFICIFRLPCVMQHIISQKIAYYIPAMCNIPSQWISLFTESPLMEETVALTWKFCFICSFYPNELAISYFNSLQSRTSHKI